MPTTINKDVIQFEAPANQRCIQYVSYNSSFEYYTASTKTIHWVTTRFRAKNTYWWLQTLPTLCNRYVPEGLLQVRTDYTHGQLFMSTQVSPNEKFTELYTRKTNSSLYTAFISTVDSVNKGTTIMTWNTSAECYETLLIKVIPPENDIYVNMGWKIYGPIQERDTWRIRNNEELNRSINGEYVLKVIKAQRVDGWDMQREWRWEQCWERWWKEDCS